MMGEQTIGANLADTGDLLGTPNPFAFETGFGGKPLEAATPYVAIPMMPCSPQTTTSGSQSVPSGMNKITLRLPRQSWPEIGSPVIAARVEQSLDNGQSWSVVAGFSVQGGNRNNRSGVPLTENVVTVDAPISGRVRVVSVPAASLLTQHELRVE